MSLKSSKHANSQVKNFYDTSRKEVKQAKTYLRSVSASEFPSVVAAVEGAGSYPYRLYSSIGFDKLHVWEHGVSRMLTDDAFKVFASHPQYDDYSKSKIVSIGNQRIQDIPRSAQLKRFPAFRKNPHETRAGITGKMGRDLLCFLWSSVMGISKSVTPDDDCFVQLLLKADLFQRMVMGVNLPSQDAKRTFEKIQEVSKLGFEVGEELVTLFECPVNTKIHRIMRYLIDHLVDCGCIRAGSTDDYETLHKRTKHGYKSTNKNAFKLAPQLLAARTNIELMEKGNAAYSINGRTNLGDNNLGMAQLLITRSLSTTQPSLEKGISSEASESSFDVEYMEQLSGDMRKSIRHARCIEDAESILEREIHITSNTKVWHAVKSARFIASLPWAQNQRVYQVVYAGVDVFNHTRRDAVEYTHDQKTHCGFIQVIFAHNRTPKARIALLRRLKQVPAEQNNRNVVEKYGNLRFAYLRYREDIQIDCVPISSFVRKLLLVPDTWVVSRVYGPDMKISELPDTRAARLQAAFFEVAGYQFSSFPSQTENRCPSST